MGAEAGKPGPLVTGAPYSADAVTDITQTLADGNKIHQTNTTRVYRDSQGRTRREPGLNALNSAAPWGATFTSGPRFGYYSSTDTPRIARIGMIYEF